MRSFQVPGSKAAQSSSGAKKRMIAMIVGLLVIGSLFATNLLKARAFRNTSDPDLPLGAPEMSESIAIPKIDVAQLERLVDDELPRERVVLESEAVDALLRDARRMTPASFKALGTAELSAGLATKMLEEPGAHRGQAFTARGTITTLRSRQRASQTQEEHLGTIELEDGTTVYFLALDVPDLGGFVRLDGFFLKAFSEEAPDAEGGWVEGPFLIGPRAVRSFASLGTVETLDPALLAAIRDDVLITPDRSPPVITGLPFRPRWHLLGYARDVAPGSIDWASVPELDTEAMAALVENGRAFRGQPFRIPISRLQGARVRAAAENPLRLEALTEGWIGNVTWKNVVHFQAPFADYDLTVRDYVYGRGFFFKNFAYESEGRGLRVAPVFVLESLHQFLPEQDPFFATFFYVLVATAAGLVILFIAILRRDRRKAVELQEELLRRKRARRERSMGTASS